MQNNFSAHKVEIGKATEQHFNLRWNPSTGTCTVEGHVFSSPEALWKFLSSRADIALERGDIAMRYTTGKSQNNEEVEAFIAKNGRFAVKKLPYYGKETPEQEAIRKNATKAKLLQKRIAKETGKNNSPVVPLSAF